MKVVCIKCDRLRDYEFITPGREYDVIDVFFYNAGYGNKYLIINDNNEEFAYETLCFMDIKQQRKKKLERIINNE